LDRNQRGILISMFCSEYPVKGGVEAGDRGRRRCRRPSVQDLVIDVFLFPPRWCRGPPRGELAPGVDLEQAGEWVAIALSTLRTLTSAMTVDLEESVAVGRFYAHHLCRGLAATEPRAHRTR
jgi:hypothetical protein